MICIQGGRISPETWMPREAAVEADAVGTFCLFVCPHDKSKMVEATFGTRDILWRGIAIQFIGEFLILSRGNLCEN